MEETHQAHENIRQVDIEEEMRVSYLRYAMSVIVSRALPDVRDGLKPSQRRILYTLNDLNLTSRAKYRKCAKIVGDTNGNYHPHGDSAVYQTMVRMAQSFSIRYPLVDGQGNFGSVDGDPPAAMRYTEARMTNSTMEILADIEMDTVKFIANYDETRTEPTVLPARFPNLLCNGGSGIAVGVATNIAPHNLTEVCDGLLYLLDNPECSVDELLPYIKGPDFPTGGIICGISGIVSGYKTGRGRIVVRSRYHVEEMKNGRQQLVFTEIPYQVNKVTVIEKIVEEIKNDRIQGISDVTDESDKDGMRLIVELKKGEDPQVVINQLFKYTPLQDSFNINAIALVGGKPQRLTLKDFLTNFRDHRIDVIRRRTQFLLDKAEKRAHILEGLRIAIDHIDEIIAIIRAAVDTGEARDRLMSRFALSELQAQAILDMQLRRLTGLERDKIEQEYQELQAKIAEYRGILISEEKVLELIREDLRELKQKFGDERRSQIGPTIEDFEDEDLIPDEDMIVFLSHAGYIKRLLLDEFKTQGRGGRGVTGMQTREEDFTEFIVAASSKDYLLLFTNMGRVYWLKTYHVPQGSRTSKGRAIVNVLDMVPDEKVLTAIPVAQFDDRQIIMATENGTVKKSLLSDYSRPKKGGIKAIVLDEGDRLIDVKLTTGNETVVLSSSRGLSVTFAEEECRTMGRVSRGVRGMSLRENDRVVSMNIVKENASILTICEKGYGKKSDFSDFRVTHRGGLGVKTIANIDRNGLVVRSLTVLDDDEVLILTRMGMVLRFAIQQLRTLGRATSGVRLINLKDGDTIEAVVPLPKDEAEDLGGGEAGALPPAEIHTESGAETETDIGEDSQDA